MGRYAALTVACTKLLHCVQVPGTPSHQSFLFIQGSKQCNYLGWQLLPVVFVAGLVVVPLLLPHAASWSRRPHGASDSPTRQQWRLAVRLALVESYDQAWYWWESALMAQRLALALVYTFLSSFPGIQALVLATMCAVFCAVHNLCRPLRSPQAQSLQGVLLLCLTVRALVGVLQEGVALGGGSGSAAPTGVKPLMVLFSVVVPLLAAAWAFLAHRVAVPAAWCRATARSSGCSCWPKKHPAASQ